MFSQTLDDAFDQQIGNADDEPSFFGKRQKTIGLDPLAVGTASLDQRLGADADAGRPSARSGLDPSFDEARIGLVRKGDRSVATSGAMPAQIVRHAAMIAMVRRCNADHRPTCSRCHLRRRRGCCWAGG